MSSMYENIMTLPLFRGVSYAKISEIIETSRLHFLKFSKGEVIAQAGEMCTHVRFIINGSVRLTIACKDQISVEQTLKSPDVISPSYLFGMDNTYPGTAVAYDDDTAILQITKSDYLKILDKDEVFMFNYLNLLAKGAQANMSGLQALIGESAEHRIAYWILSFTQDDATDIKVNFSPEQLPDIFGIDGEEALQALEKMTKKGLIYFSPDGIVVGSRRALRDIIYKMQI